jgi:hypothetical protein
MHPSFSDSTVPVTKMVRFLDSYTPYQRYLAEAKTGDLELPLYY